MRLLVVAGALLLAACAGDKGSSDGESPTEEVAEGETLSAETTLGPVVARVSVTPKEPVIGDIMSLQLEVEAEAGVDVEMPVFLEALSRFSIEGEGGGAKREVLEGGGERHIQKYRMQAASSGRMRIPPLRVVFRDERAGSEASAGEQELLTEELSLKIQPVLVTDDATEAELRPVRRSLEEDLGPGLWARYWWAFAAGAGGLLVLGGLVVARRSRKVESISPYERASVALGRLEARGLPEGEELDAWYVELSSIVRRYLEDRFQLRAPELTTEEFLREAQRSVHLSAEHKSLLVGFLADCDRVKFAGYEPDAEESRALLEAARKFLLETREERPETESSPTSPTSQEEAA